MNRKLRIAGIAVLVLSSAGGAVWAARLWSQHSAEQAALAKLAKGDAQAVRDGLLALSKDDLSGPDAAETRRKAMENMRRQPFGEMMRLADDESLTEEQRRKLRENTGEIFRGLMEDRVNEFFTASKEEKEKVLDRHLDEFLEFRKQMEAEREKRKDDPEQKAREERWRQQGPRRDTQQAKERMEGGNPDQQAKMMYYFGQLRARAEARGVEFGGWGGRGGGPRGGSGGGQRGGSGR